MPVPSVSVRNLTNEVQHLQAADGSTLPLMPKAKGMVRLKYVDWAAPSPKKVFIEATSLAAAKDLDTKQKADAAAKKAAQANPPTA